MPSTWATCRCCTRRRSRAPVDDPSVPAGVYRLWVEDVSAQSAFDPTEVLDVVVVKGATTDVGDVLLANAQAVQAAQNACSVDADCGPGGPCVAAQCTT